MKHQNTSPSDGTFTGNKGSQTSSPGDAATSTQGWTKAETDYPQYKRQNTQAGWDGSFVGIRIPSPLSTDGDGGGSQLGSFSPVSFSGFNLPGEASGPVGPTSGPANGQPTNGSFPGDGTSFDGFNRQSER